MQGARSLSGSNGINIVRLCLVLLVVLSHSYTLGRYGPSPDWLGQTPGRWALAGLFAVSGFLVVSGARRLTVGKFLWARISRLWPAFFACLLVIAAVIAPIGYVVSNSTIDGYLTAENGPLRFLFLNAFFEMRQTVISGTPDRFGWAGNLWTIVYTVAAYIFLALLLSKAKGRLALPAVAVAWLLATLIHANIELLSSYLQSGQASAFFRFLPYFMGGALVGLLKRRLPFSIVYGAVALIVAVAFSWANPSWGTQFTSPLFAYGLVSIGLSFSGPKFFQDHDYSLGMFMYSFAVQKLLRLFGVHELLGDPILFFFASALATLPFAILSWHFIERPLLVSRRSANRPEPQREVQSSPSV